MRALLILALALGLGLAASNASAYEGQKRPFVVKPGPYQTLEYNGIAPVFSGPPPLYWFDATISTLPNLHNGRVFVTTLPNRCWQRSNVNIGWSGCDPEYTDPVRVRLEVSPTVATDDTWRAGKKFRLD